jgi:hypothetical protein
LRESCRRLIVELSDAGVVVVVEHVLRASNKVADAVVNCTVDSCNPDALVVDDSFVRAWPCSRDVSARDALFEIASSLGGHDASAGPTDDAFASLLSTMGDGRPRALARTAPTIAELDKRARQERSAKARLERERGVAAAREAREAAHSEVVERKQREAKEKAKRQRKRDEARQRREREEAAKRAEEADKRELDEELARLRPIRDAREAEWKKEKLDELCARFRYSSPPPRPPAGYSRHVASTRAATRRDWREREREREREGGVVFIEADAVARLGDSPPPLMSWIHGPGCS